MSKCQISPITSHEELIKAIGLTSGGVGIQEYETTNISDFLEWYKVDTSFCTEEGKLIAQQVIAFLQESHKEEITLLIPPLTSDKEAYLYAYVDALVEALNKLGEH